MGLSMDLNDMIHKKWRHCGINRVLCEFCFFFLMGLFHECDVSNMGFFHGVPVAWNAWAETIWMVQFQVAAWRKP